MKDGRTFARLMEEYGSQEEDKREEVIATKQESKLVVPAEIKKGNKKLMQDEERLTGAVTWSVYSRYYEQQSTILNVTMRFAIRTVIASRDLHYPKTIRIEAVI